ncbi:MAG: hypothetical protein KY445_05685 [Armatimonadetes bacterium]|nr:hypothetical protein [Armatimonadota bacterium]
MSIAAKGLRSIVVDGKQYHWKVGRQEYYYQNAAEWTINVVIQCEDSEALLLVKTAPSKVNPVFLVPERVVKPKDVANFVK